MVVAAEVAVVEVAVVEVAVVILSYKNNRCRLVGDIMRLGDINQMAALEDPI